MNRQRREANWGSSSARFLCDYCSKLKSPMQYSNKELDKYRFKKGSGQNVNHITAKLRCKECTGVPVTELECAGPCGLWRGLDEFSKNARTQGDKAWCVTCTRWRESHEHGVTTRPAPNNDVAPDEETMLDRIYNTHGDSESDSDSEWDDGAALENMSLTDTPSQNDMDEEYIPPNLRGQAKSQKSMSNPYAVSVAESTQASTNDEEGWQKQDRKRGKNTPKTYNGWDPQGIMHQRVATTNTSTVLNDRINRSDTSGSAAKPPKIEVRKNGWAKVPGTKKGLDRSPSPERIEREPVIQQYRDDDDSDDEM